MGSTFLQVEVMTTLWNMCQLFSMRGQTLFIATFKWKLPFHQGLLHQPATHSKQHSILHFTAFQAGWSVMMWLTLLQRIAQIFPLKAAPGPPSIFHGTENSWVKTQLPLADAKYFLRWFYVPIYMDFHMVVTGTMLSRAEIWTGLQKPDSHLSCLYVSDIKQGICTFLFVVN